MMHFTIMIAFDGNGLGYDYNKKVIPAHNHPVASDSAQKSCLWTPSRKCHVM